ncbi:MAG: DUF6438 domain-containing protein [Flavobacteriales bacterium]|nr:DUF6438 domain-containing protein [Flavobacteriales bacterium]
MKKLLFIIGFCSIGAVVLNSCKSNKLTTTAGAQTAPKESIMQTEPQLLASIERTACYGRCPMYKATFLDNGEVIYVGKRFVDKEGTYKTLISQEEVLEIKKKITELDYFGLDSLYPTPISDFPSCITEASLNGKRKKVIDRRSPPENLMAFERFLDGMLEGKELEKISDETNYEER